MTPDSIRKANNIAKKFNNLAEAVLKTERKSEEKPSFGWIETGKLSGALRRHSMELTRALAEMRKP